MQLDIFNDSRDIVLRNDVVQALEYYDAQHSRTAWHILRAEYPNADIVPVLAALILILEQRSDAPFQDHAALHAARQKLSDIESMAMQVFGKSQAFQWLKTLWCELAQRAAPLPFLQHDGEAHAAALWLHAQEWAAAFEATSNIASWRRIPQTLNWAAEAGYRLNGLEASWTLLAELAWLSPTRFDLLTKRLDEPVLTGLRKSFDAHFEGNNSITDLTWFPAWVLTQQTRLAQFLKEAQPTRHNGPERAFQLLMELLVLEKQGRHHDIIEHRKALQSVQRSLFAAYMESRK